MLAAVRCLGLILTDVLMLFYPCLVAQPGWPARHRCLVLVSRHGCGRQCLLEGISSASSGLPGNAELVLAERHM